MFAPETQSRAETAAFLQDNYPGLDSGSVAAVLDDGYLQLPVASTTRAAWFTTAALAYGETTFVCPSHMIAECVNVRSSSSDANATRSNATKSNSNSTNSTDGPQPQTWMYRYNVANVPDIARGVGIPHGAQGPMSFGTAGVAGPTSYRTYNAPMVPLGMHYYASFVRALDPNVHRLEGAPAWLPWMPRTRQRLVFELGSTRMETVSADESKRCALWEGVAQLARQ